jgi:hypothetical protein
MIGFNIQYFIRETSQHTETERGKRKKNTPSKLLLLQPILPEGEIG